VEGVIAPVPINISARANVATVISAKKCLQCSQTVLDCGSGSAKGVLQPPGGPAPTECRQPGH
jgi:hypothetical protein